MFEETWEYNRQLLAEQLWSKTSFEVGKLLLHTPAARQSMLKCVGHSGALKAMQCVASSLPDAGRTRDCGRQCKMGRDLQRKSKSVEVC